VVSGCSGRGMDFHVEESPGSAGQGGG